VTEEEKKFLQAEAVHIRSTILKLARQASQANKGAHLGGALSIVEFLVCLYLSKKFTFQGLSCDRFILSKGHACLALYSVLNRIGLIPIELISGYPEPATSLQGHPLKDRELGIEFSTGSLGMGASLAAGIAISKKRKSEGGRVFVMLGDGECSEGAVWEAIMFSKQHQLSNLVFVIDNNGFQQTGSIKDISGNDDLASAVRGFGIQTNSINGQSITDIINALSNLNTTGPNCLVLKTSKGAGIPNMENNNIFHHTSISEKQFDEFTKDLTIGLA
jgi:transketolase